ncbi:MAG: PP2C family protein-serine/threonine phosphatase, partial [Wenzhouxiangellaceae bacterium]
LCSDGLSGEVEDEEIARWFASIESPRELAEKLVACALDNGGRDNVSLIVLDAPTNSGQPSRRLWRQLR